MKKINVIFALLMMVGFAGVASSATLSWGNTPAGASLTDTGGSTISAQYGFGHQNVHFSHSYNFMSSDATSPILAQFNELPRNSINITSITFDNVAMTFDLANKIWFGNGATNTLAHLIQIIGINHHEGSQYQLTATVSSVPIPAALWLFGSAFAGLLGISTRKTGSKALTA